MAETIIFKVTIFTKKKEVINDVLSISPIADTGLLVILLLNGSSIVYTLRTVKKYIIEKE